jgi:hypothetical protein
VLGVILLVAEYYLKISIVFWTIGLIVLVIGVVLLLIDHKARAIGGRRYRY